jgi:protein-S-isoprenylcysteine O-methyltransferase Ste14
LSIKQDQTLDKPVNNIKKQALIGLAALAAVLWLALFLPAGSLNYWQAWTYWLVFSISVSAISIYFLKKDLNLIASRLKTGPTAEKEKNQKLANSLISIFFILLILIPPFDHRFQLSNVPSYLVLAADVFVALGLLIIFLVFKQNSFTSAVIEVNKGQKVISTGPYAVVRHPMYSGALLMLLFTPLALGSFWGLLAFIPTILVIALRVVEEEKFLKRNLSGYDEYCKKIHHRLIPFVW